MGQWKTCVQACCNILTNFIHEDAITVNNKTIGDNCRGSKIILNDVIKSYAAPLKPAAGFTVLKGNLFESAIMKTSVIDEEFRNKVRFTCN